MPLPDSDCNGEAYRAGDLMARPEVYYFTGMGGRVTTVPLSVPCLPATI